MKISMQKKSGSLERSSRSSDEYPVKFGSKIELQHKYNEKSGFYNWMPVDQAPEEMLNEENFEGPKYFGCVRMVTSRFLHFVFFVELI